MLIGLGLTTSLWAGVIVLMGLGITDAVSMATRQTTMRLTTPDNMRGKVVGFNNVSAMRANNIGTFEVGFMSGQVDSGNAMLPAVAVGIVVALVEWRSRRAIRECGYP